MFVRINRKKGPGGADDEEEDIVKTTALLDESKYQGVVLQYVQLANKMKLLTVSDPFNQFIIGCICVAGLLVGIQTYPEFADNPSVTAVDDTILGIFTAECVAKIIAEGPYFWRYWTGTKANKADRGWNNFDFWIVVACYLPNLGGTVALLRMMRLMRVAKLVRKIPELQMILMGLVGGMTSICYILLLMFLMFYLYAITGILLFGDVEGQNRSDQFHFSDMFAATLTLWRMATMEDWTDVMYINMYGCESGQVYRGYYAQSDDPKYEGHQWLCQAHKKDPYLTVIWSVSFIVLSGLVMLSLFIGAITMSMTEAMEKSMRQRKREHERKRREKAIKKKEKLEARAKAREERMLRGLSSGGSPGSSPVPGGTPGSPMSPGSPGRGGMPTKAEAKAEEKTEKRMHELGKIWALKTQQAGKTGDWTANLAIILE